MAPPRKKPRVSDVVAQDKDDKLHIAETTAPETNAAKAEEDPNAEPQRQRRQLFVRSLPTSTTTESLTELFSQNYPIKHATAVLNKETKQCKGFGFVTFADAEDAARAKEEFNGHVLDGKKIRIEIAEHRQRDEKGVSQKPERVKEQDKKDEDHLESGTKLIVRNLPWSIKHNSHLEKLFQSYGKVKSAQVVKKRDGLLTGFGFVTMRGRKNAEKAIEGVNGKDVDGRTIAVDWAVQKDIYTGKRAPGDEKVDGSTSVVSGEKDDTEAEDFVKINGLDDDASEDVDEDDEGSEDEDNEEDNEALDKLEDGEDEDDDEEMNRTEDKSATLFIRNLPFTCTDEDLEEHFTQFGATRYARVVIDPATERPRGTGFICFYNIEDADTCIRAAPQPQVAKPAETKGKGAAASQLHSVLQDETLDPTGKFTLDGRVLQVARAVNKSEANRLTQEGVANRFKRDNDKRRLYLLQEGTISPKTSLWETLSPSERTMREASAKQRKTLIESNPSLHLSLTRLSIRNVPRSITSKDLKQLAREAVVGFAKDITAGKRQRLSKEELSRGGEEMIQAEQDRRARAKGIVKQAKIVFEGQEGGKVNEGSGAGRSRGYGFIEYHTHRSALMGLRWLNGHQIDYKAYELEKGKDKGKNVTKEVLQERKKRLIAEFAIENANVVKRRSEREDKAREDAKNPRPKEEEKKDERTSKGGPRDNKRKRSQSESGRDGARPAEDEEMVDDEKSAKRERIIQKKRMQRRAKRQGKVSKA